MKTPKTLISLHNEVVRILNENGIEIKYKDNFYVKAIVQTDRETNNIFTQYLINYDTPLNDGLFLYANSVKDLLNKLDKKFHPLKGTIQDIII